MPTSSMVLSWCSSSMALESTYIIIHFIWLTHGLQNQLFSCVQEARKQSGHVSISIIWFLHTLSTVLAVIVYLLCTADRKINGWTKQLHFLMVSTRKHNFRNQWHMSNVIILLFILPDKVINTLILLFICLLIKQTLRLFDIFLTSCLKTLV